MKSTMPSSVAYSEPRTLASDHGRAWNRAHRSGTEPKASNMDEGRQDIFLNIARSDSDRRESLGRSDFRRVSPLIESLLVVPRPSQRSQTFP